MKKIADDFGGFLKQLKEPEPWEDDDEYEDDDEDFNRNYTKEELVEFIEEGSSLFHVSASLGQFAHEKGDMSWFINQSIKALNKKSWIVFLGQ